MTDTDTFGKTRTERKKEATKQKIIAAALDLIRRQGYAATTMEQIAAAADIAKGTLYNYFPVKEAIVDEYIKRSFRENNADRVRRLAGLPDTRSRLRRLFGELITGVQASRDFFDKYIIYRTQILLSFRVEESEKSGFYLAADKIIEWGQANGEIRTDIPRFLVDDLLEFAFIEAVKQFYLEPERFDPGTAVELCVNIFINAVKPEAK